jgi:DNA-directed RNA polymerase subunit M/transcription elongation factor TFIIS
MERLMIDTSVCNYCFKRVNKVFSKMRGKQRIYIDNTTGEEWSGSRCPECYANYKKQYDIKRRLKKGHTPLHTICVCEECGKQYELTNGKSNKYCGDC